MSFEPDDLMIRMFSNDPSGMTLNPAIIENFASVISSPPASNSLYKFPTVSLIGAMLISPNLVR